MHPVSAAPNLRSIEGSYADQTFCDCEQVLEILTHVTSVKCSINTVYNAIILLPKITRKTCEQLHNYRSKFTLASQGGMKKILVSKIF